MLHNRGIIGINLVFAEKTQEGFFGKAKQAELDDWRKHKVIRNPTTQELRQLQRDNCEVISGRWVLTWKDRKASESWNPEDFRKCYPKLSDTEFTKLVEGIPMGKKPKARLVVRGFEEDFRGRKESPTAKLESLGIFLSIAATTGWKIRSLDIPTAFLRGKDVDRELYFKVPKDLVNMGFNETVKIVRVLYGLMDGPKLFYEAISTYIMKELGLVRSADDKGLFVPNDKNGNLDMILIAF